MAKKSKEPKATTAKSATATAKRNPFGDTGVRLAGAILAFIGIMLCMEKGTLSSTIITVTSIALIIGGFFIAVSNLRSMVKTKRSGAALGYFFVGLLVLVAGILCAVYSSQLSQWFIVILGSLIAAYGLGILIRFAIRGGSKARTILGLVLATLTIIDGILIALLVLPQVSGAINGACYYIFGALGIAIGATELVCY